MSDQTVPQNNYPLPHGGFDPRFSFHLGGDVIDVLLRHGYPPLTSGDFERLQAALFRFLYEPDTSPAAALAEVPADLAPRRRDETPRERMDRIDATAQRLAERAS